METTQKFVKHVLLPYQKIQVEKLALLEEKNMI
jgi:hypothetical protein